MAAVQHLRPAKQLTFDLFPDGADPDEAPEMSSFTIGGSMASAVFEAYAEDELVVHLIDPSTGNVIVKSPAYVSAIGFKKHRKKGERPWIERKHTVKLGEIVTDTIDD